MGEEWLIFEWPGYHLYQAIAPMKAWQLDFAKFGCGLSKVVVTYSGGTTCFCVIRDEFEKNGEKFFNIIKNRPEILFKILKEADEAADKIFELEKKWKNIKFENLSDSELLKCHQELFKWDEILWRRGQFQSLLEFYNNFLTTHVKKIIVNKFGAKNEIEYFGAISQPVYKTITERQDEDFAKLIKKADKSKKEIYLRKLAKNHWKKYTWMIYGWTGPALDYEYFFSNLKLSLKNKNTLKVLNNKKAERKVLLGKQKNILNKLDKEERKLALLLRALLEGKAKRVDAHSLTFYIADKINLEISKRTFLSLNQLRALPPFEIKKALKEDIADQLNKESGFVAYWFEKNKGVKKFVGEKGRNKFKYVLKRVPKVEKTDELKGELAYPGRVKGKVRLILSQDDFNKFKKGEILVTRVTDPSYVPIMKIAKAIITDIGGITCHAAIVARELKKPCVIGTKIATKVLKDGDLVEVDANKGIIKIIKNNG